ncbi:transmembrane 4 L6 family member 18 [Brienomyrus brachyistius]|uniref:transmembrane 4 L6 family member 18 n=1 Tax=Brienomyrus brachyistius TaxID=42636 RepID=UPI0020B31004|nr:transmembrane 4 L6 family member 18 [Brienomyrus brachyistius]
MSSRTFAWRLGVVLFVLAIFCILANTLLYFPNWKADYATDKDQLSKYVWYFAGISGGGLVIFLPAAVFMSLDDCRGRGSRRSCGTSCALFGSVTAALIGLVGSGYCFVISAMALMEGPLCWTGTKWTYPFENQAGQYLMNHTLWEMCKEPEGVVEWNVSLFSILLALSGVEALICAVQAIAGLLGGLCRGWCHRSHYTLNA